MQKGYWIMRIDIHDLEQIKEYVESTPAILKKYGARFLVRGGEFMVPEGSSRSRNTLVEFPSYQAALDCWHSEEYQQVLKLRLPVSTTDLVIVEGFDGPQP